MSSHHVVRDLQEPALIIANGEACSETLLGELLEWSPYVVVLDGAIRVYRWSNAAQALAQVESTASEVLWTLNGPVEILSLPHGIGQDRAEAITAVPANLSGKDPQWLVLYDAPSAARIIGEQTVLGVFHPHADR